MFVKYLMVSALALSFGVVAASADQSLSSPPTPPTPATAPALPMTARDAVFKAADAAPAGIAGRFRVTIQAAGHQDGHVYLNTEMDYRDQRNLSVDICPEALDGMKAKFGDNLEGAFIGKEIEVKGIAHRVKITFLADGKPTDKYYYQTHVLVCSANQVALVSPAT